MATKKRSVSNRLTVRELDITCYISHSHRDGRDYAARLGEQLQAAGVRILSPEALSPGSRWVEVLKDFMDRADALILVCTPEALASEWVLEEAEYFFVHGGRVLPIVFRGATNYNEFPLFLRSILSVQEDISALRKGPSQDALVRLVDALEWEQSEGRRKLRRKLSKPSPTQSRPEKRPLNEGKLILVGRGEVGKTSLVKRLVENDFNGARRSCMLPISSS